MTEPSRERASEDPGREDRGAEPARLAAGLRHIRKRRWFLWGVFLTYLPAIWLSLEITGSDAATAVVFGIWVVLAAVAGCVVTFARCPRCGNHFHMNGPVPMWLRRCLHCELSLVADKRSRRTARRAGRR